MGKIAFVFSGQGDQYIGMGKSFYEKYPVAKNIFDKLDRIRNNTKFQCFDGSNEELKETKNTQPCLFAMEMAGAFVLKEIGIEPSAVAGFSLGEVVALTYAGCVSLEEGFNLVCRRGEIMQREADKYNTAMVAVVKLDPDIVKNITDKYTKIYPVNFNCPGNISVSGDAKQILSFMDEVKCAGGRAIPLKVKGAFHSPYMQQASISFAKELDLANFNEPKIQLYSNVTAKPYEGHIKELLSKQISNPVLWEEIIRNMIKSGIDTFIEIGPGKTLINMIGKISQDVKTYSISDMEQILLEVEHD